jgi:hypothetical protein
MMRIPDQTNTMSCAPREAPTSSAVKTMTSASRLRAFVTARQKRRNWMPWNTSGLLARAVGQDGAVRARTRQLAAVGVLELVRVIVAPLPSLLPVTSELDPATGFFEISDPLGPLRSVIPILDALLYIVVVVLACWFLRSRMTNERDMVRVVAFALAAVTVIGFVLLQAAGRVPLLVVVGTVVATSAAVPVVAAVVAFAVIGFRSRGVAAPSFAPDAGANAREMSTPLPARTGSAGGAAPAARATPYEPLQARSVTEAPDDLYPLPSTGVNSFELESGDGTDLVWWEAEAVTATIGGRGEVREVAHAERIKGAVALTDSRLVFACTEFRTGGGWRGYGLGGAAVAVAANAVSKSRSIRETQGFTLVGHVRHEWLGGVTASASSWGTSAANAVSLLYADPTGEIGICRLNLHFPKQQSTAEIARALLKRAVRWQLADTGLEEPKRAELRAFLAALPSTPTSGGNGRAWTMP